MSRPDEVSLQRLAACLQAFTTANYVRNDNIPCQIEKGLFLGSVGAALNKTALKELNITHVLIAARSLDPPYPGDFKYKKIDVLDSPDVDLAKHFDECFDFIEEGRTAGGVLVHCFAGMSRSVTIVVAYLMKKHDMSLTEALSLVKSKRKQSAPNKGFLKQLEDFENSLRVSRENKSRGSRS